MTDDEYRSFLSALTRKHRKYTQLYFDVAALRSTVLALKVLRERDDPGLMNIVTSELKISQPVNACTGLMEQSGILDALDDGNEIVLGELRTSSVPNEDADFLRTAGFEDHEIDVFLPLAIRGAHTAAAAGRLPSNIAADAEQKMADTLAKLLTLAPGAPGTRAKRKCLNAIGKFIGGAVTGIGSVVLLTGSGADAGAGALASCGVAIGSFFCWPRRSQRGVNVSPYQ